MPVPHLDEIMNNFGIGKVKRVTQTEKKSRPQENIQLKKYEPLCSQSNQSKFQKHLFEHRSAMKENFKVDYNRELTEQDLRRICQPNFDSQKCSDEILIEDEYYLENSLDTQKEISVCDIKSQVELNGFGILSNHKTQPKNSYSERAVFGVIVKSEISEDSFHSPKNSMHKPQTTRASKRDDPWFNLQKDEDPSGASDLSECAQKLQF